MNRTTRALAGLMVTSLLGGLPAQATRADTYGLTFELQLRAASARAVATIEVTQAEPLLLEARFRAPLEQYGEFHGDGAIRRDGDFVTWTPPAQGGRIEYFANLEHQRSSGSYDSLVTPDWALFRADDAFPPAHVRHRAGARSVSKLRVSLPKDWALITPYAEGPTGEFVIENPDRAFDRPTGWLIAGKLGRRKDLISDIVVSVAAPIGVGTERIAMLALLRWTLPYLEREVDQLPPRLSIVSAGAPMWRGGLSANNSVYVHADRPLLSENATSTLLHETLHVLIPVPTQRDHDWIDEGIAEYLTLRLLRDSGTIAPKRFNKAIDGFNSRGASVMKLTTANASGAVRARAVTIFARLDSELLELTDGKTDIYDLVRYARAAAVPLNDERLREAARALTGAARIESLVFADPPRAPTPIAESNLTK